MLYSYECANVRTRQIMTKNWTLSAIRVVPFRRFIFKKLLSTVSSFHIYQTVFVPFLVNWDYFIIFCLRTHERAYICVSFNSFCIHKKKKQKRTEKKNSEWMLCRLCWCMECSLHAHLHVYCVHCIYEWTTQHIYSRTISHNRLLIFFCWMPV